jgi:hypothetical protein
MGTGYEGLNRFVAEHAAASGRYLRADDEPRPRARFLCGRMIASDALPYPTQL